MSIKPPERLTNLNDAELTLPPDAEAQLLEGIERHLKAAAAKRTEQSRREAPTTEVLLEGLRTQASRESHEAMNQRFKKE